MIPHRGGGLSMPFFGFCASCFHIVSRQMADHFGPTFYLLRRSRRGTPNERFSDTRLCARWGLFFALHHRGVPRGASPLDLPKQCRKSWYAPRLAGQRKRHRHAQGHAQGQQARHWTDQPPPPRRPPPRAPDLRKEQNDFFVQFLRPSWVSFFALPCPARAVRRPLAVVPPLARYAAARLPGRGCLGPAGRRPSSGRVAFVAVRAVRRPLAVVSPWARYAVARLPARGCLGSSGRRVRKS